MSAARGDDSDVLLIDVDLADADEFVLLSRIVELRGQRRPVIATAQHAAVNDVRRLMRLGVVDFVPQPVTKADLEHAISGASQRLAQSSAGKGGSIVTFLRAAGGTGATTLATHAAFALAQRTPPQRVAFVDLDLQRGAAALHLDIKSDIGVANCLERYPSIEPGLIESVASKHASGIDAFVATERRSSLEEHSPEAIAQMLDVMRRVYDWVIVDTPPVWTRWHHALLERSNLAVLVVQKTVANLRAARSMLGALHAEMQADQIVTVCNRVERGWFARSFSTSEVENALGRPVDCSVPSAFGLVSEAVNLGVPVSQVKAKSKFEKATVALAEELERRVARKRLSLTPSVEASTVQEGWGDEIRHVAV
jgi:pilus assembly protein CpaE